jgi:hypothetical protein
MPVPWNQFSGQGAALLRAADAMLRSLGGREVSLLFPMVTAPGDTGVQLGAMDPGVEEVRIFPVIVRNLRAETRGTRMHLEFLMPAGVLWSKIEDRQSETAEAFFDAALGLVCAGRLLRIETVDTEYFAGTAYLYRVVAGE